MQGYVAIVVRQSKPRKGGESQEKISVVDLNTAQADLAQQRLAGLGLIKEGQTVYLAEIKAKAAVRPAEVVLEQF